MLVPHLHLNGHYREALTLYEKAFATKVDHLQLISEQEPELGEVHAENLETADPIIMNGDVHYLPQCLKHYELRIAIPAASKRPGMIFSNNVKLFVGAVPRSMYQIDNQVVDWRPRVHVDLHKSVADIYRSVQDYAPFHFFINGGLAMDEDIGEFPMKEILIGNDGLELDDYVLKNYFGKQKPPEYMERLKEK